MMNRLAEVQEKQIEEFCRKWSIRELQAFGSVIRNDFRPDSDIDLVVEFQPGTLHTLLHVAKMEKELEQMFGRPVDLITKRALEQSRNHIRKRSILASMVPLYVA